MVKSNESTNHKSNKKETMRFLLAMLITEPLKLTD